MPKEERESSRAALEQSWRELSRQLELSEQDLDSLPMQYEARLQALARDRDSEASALQQRAAALTEEHKASLAALATKLEKLRYRTSHSVPSPSSPEHADDLSARLTNEMAALRLRAKESQLDYMSRASRLEERTAELKRLTVRRHTPEVNELLRLRAQLALKTDEIVELDIRLRALADAFESTRGFRYPGTGQPVTLKSLQSMLNRTDTELIRRASKNAALQYEVTELKEQLEAAGGAKAVSGGP